MKSFNFNKEFLIRLPSHPISKNELNNEEIIAFFKSFENLNSLFIASPILHGKFLKLTNNKITDQKEIQKIVISLKKYHTRITTRCTPFGAFSATGIGTWSNENDIRLKSFVNNFYIDFEYLQRIINIINSDPLIKKEIKYQINNSYYIVNNKFRYVETINKNNKTSYELNSVDYNFYLKKIILFLDKGAKRFKDLKTLLISNNISEKVSEDFIIELIDNNILISNFFISPTSSEPITDIITKLDEYQLERTFFYSKKLNEIRSILVGLNNNHLFFNSNLFITENNKIIAILFELDIVTENNKAIICNRTCQFYNAILSNDIQKEIFSAINLMSKLIEVNKSTYLTDFIKKFTILFENKLIPLSEAIDSEIGVGFAGNSNNNKSPNPLLSNLLFTTKKSNINNYQINYTENLLYKKIIECLKSDERIIELSQIDLLKQKEIEDENLPDTMHLLFSKIFDKEQNEKILLKSVSGSSSTNYIARFAHLDDGINKIYQNISTKEINLNQNEILAEILHISTPGLNNILIRPKNKNYEIPYISNSDLSKEKIININELYLKMHEGRLLLWSKKLNSEIIPRLSNAHNYSFDSLPIYHFLCELQFQNIQTGIFFDLSNIKKLTKYIPRIQHKNVIVYPETWVLDNNDLAFIKKEIDENKRAIEILKKFKIPQIFNITDSDNNLKINLENELDNKVFYSIIKKKKFFYITEYFNPSDLVNDDISDKCYNNEILASIEKSKKIINKKIFLKEKIINKNIQKTFLPFSNWTSIHIYCETNIADNLLVNIVKPLLFKLLKSKMIDGFFFIRYNDPENHIRLRFHTENTENSKVFSDLILNKFKSNISVKDIQLRIYEREIERYQNELIYSAETVFMIDSLSTIKILDIIKKCTNEDLRWIVAIDIVLNFLSALNYSEEGKILFIENAKNHFNDEFKDNLINKERINLNYRTDLIKMKSYENEFLFKNERKNINKILKEKMTQLKKINNDLESLYKNDKNGYFIFVSSCIHMSLNRIFINSQRENEMIVYNYLHKYLITKKKLLLN